MLENRADVKSCRGFFYKAAKKDGNSFCCKFIGAAPLFYTQAFTVSTVNKRILGYVEK